MILKDRLKIYGPALAMAMVCIGFAAICSAITDTLLFKFSVSIFKDLDPTWWNPLVSWQYKSGFIVFADSFHFFKSLMLFFGSAGFLIMYITGYKDREELPRKIDWIDFLLILIATAVTWSGVFNLFYNHILV